MSAELFQDHSFKKSIMSFKRV